MTGASDTVPRPGGSVLDAGTTLGRFVVVRLIGTGGMGSVYEARDPELGRSVALKLLASDRGHHDGTIRLVREAKALAQLQHPNVVSVFDVGLAGQHVFIAMEYVDGQTLGAHLDATRPGWRQVLALFLQAGRGLAAAHARSIVHRDFKPGNVLVDREGRVRVTDFGLARLAPDAQEETAGAAGLDPDRAPPSSVTTLDTGGVGDDLRTPAGAASDVLAMSLTAAGAILGTPRYMAPEQRAGRAVTARSDQYSFCLALWEALFGELPPAAGRAGTVPRALAAALQIGLAVAPASRHPSMTALLAALERAAGTPAALRRRLLLAGALLVAGAGATAVAMGASRSAVHCDRAGAEARAEWNPETSAAVVAAFARVRPDAPEAAAPVIARLDRYAAGWQAARIDACQATYERGEQSAAMLDRRAACLDTRLVALAALARGLARVDAAGVDRALEAVNALPRLDRCAAGLLSGTAPASHDPRARASERIATEAAVAFRLGRYPEGLLQAEAALAAARAVDDPALLARALLEHGRFILLKDSKQGRAELEEGLVAAARSGDRELEADLVTRMLASLIDDGATDRVEALLPAARAAVAASHDPPNARSLASSEARILIKAHRAPAEIRAACDKIATFERPGDPPAAIECRCIAAVTTRAVAEGKEQCRALIAAKIELFGPTHPEVGFAMVNLANILDSAGEREEALALLGRAEPIYRRAFGDGTRTVVLLITMGNVLDGAGRSAEARARFERALAIVKGEGDRPTRRLATILIGLAGVSGKLGDAEAATRYGRDALRIAESVLGADHPELVGYYQNQALALADAGKWAEALTVYQRGAALAEKTMPGDLLHGMCLLGVAQALIRLGRPREALPIGEQASRIIGDHDGDPFNLASARAAVGEALLKLGERERGRAALEAARDRFRDQGPAAARELAAVELLLAR